MAAIWTGTLSFGLLHVPVRLMSGEKRVDLHFRMLDSRDNSPIRYERVNAETGEEVAWKDIAKAFEYDKGSYVVLSKEDFKAAASDGGESVDIDAFVDAGEIPVRYFEKPYVLVPWKKAEKGYVLLRETLKSTGKAGIARVMIRQREYLAAVLPQGDALVLMLMRYPQELVDFDEYKLPEGKPSDWRITQKELEMGKQLVESMAQDFAPGQYKDDYRDRLRAVIDKRMKNEGLVIPDEDEAPMREHMATNVVDFASLLKKSISENKRTPAKKTAARKTAAKKPAKKKPASVSKPAKKAPAKRARKRA